MHECRGGIAPPRRIRDTVPPNVQIAQGLESPKGRFCVSPARPHEGPAKSLPPTDPRSPNPARHAVAAPCRRRNKSSAASSDRPSVPLYDRTAPVFERPLTRVRSAAACASRALNAPTRPSLRGGRGGGGLVPRSLTPDLSPCGVASVNNGLCRPSGYVTNHRLVSAFSIFGPHSLRIEEASARTADGTTSSQCQPGPSTHRNHHRAQRAACCQRLALSCCSDLDQ